MNGMKKRLLLVVEPDFYQIHVGVRRVIRWYWHQGLQAGYEVVLATPSQGRLVPCASAIAAALMSEPTPAHGDAGPRPHWQTGDPILTSAPADVASVSAVHTPWDWERQVEVSDFDESVLTTPWMCADAAMLPEAVYSTGLVYDMVPTFLAMGVLRTPRFLDAYGFAHQHSLGYEFYLRHCRRISCISQSTRADFLSIYKQPPCEVAVCVPFSDFGNGQVRADGAEEVLLINVLDHRKNFATVSKVLRQAASRRPLKVIVVGRERMLFADTMSFFSEISAICQHVEWHRSPTDEQMEALMARAKVLLFPSIYEGLGLPILEAQAKGVPVISSNNSSCGEINLNPTLTADAYDHCGLTDRLLACLGDELPLLKGRALREAQHHFLAAQNHLNFAPRA